MKEFAFHPEDKARSLIDRRLAACGWLIQSKTDMNLGAGLGVAVREFQTGSGPVDYGLFVGRKLCGVIEAKAEGTTLSGYSEQAARYIADVPKHLVREVGQVRFEYVASGTETLFRDHADPDPVSRRVFSFHRPETLERELREPLTLRGRLRAMPPFITDGLRACQIDAVSALEVSMAQNRPRALVQMATGAGKTFTACTLSYRLLAHAGFKRILFLADRANLVRQTRDEYLAYRPPGTGRSFSEIYNVQKLGAAGLDKDAQIVVATIQRVYSVLTGKELSEEEEELSSFEVPRADAERLIAYNPSIPIESFDLVITDECHRSIYGTWRQVLEYFDAFTVGLTATPSLHTLGFFGKNLVAQYPYERSVVDGVNVGFEIFRIRTEIGERGSTVKAGYDLPVRDKRTRAERYETLDADFSYAPDQIDRSVLVPNQIRTVLETYRDSLFTELFPGRTEVPKTLVFAKDDHHAEEITTLVREVFGKGNDFAKKITYKTDGGDPEALIRSFRNDYIRNRLITASSKGIGQYLKGDLRAAVWLLWTERQPLSELPGLLDAVFTQAYRSNATARALIEAWLGAFSRNDPSIARAGLSIRQLLIARPTPRLELWRNADRRFELFDAREGPRKLAGELISGPETVSEVLSATGFDDPLRASGGYVRTVQEEIFAKATSGLLTSPGADQLLKRALAFLAPKGVLRFAEPKSRGEMARSLLRAWSEGGKEPEEATRFQIQDFLLEHLDDPRLKPQRWQEAGEQATNLMRRWLARASLKAFFSLISDHALDSHWRYREAFWSACLEKDPTVETWLALGSRIHASARAVEDLKGAYARLDGANGDQAVLLLRVKNLIFCEWSHNGKLRAWPADWSNAPRLERKSYTRSELTGKGLPFPRNAKFGSNGSADGMGLSHIGSDRNLWQGSAAELLAQRARIVLAPADWRP